MTKTMREAFVEVLRDFDEVKQIGAIADRLMEELGKAVMAVEPGGCAPPVYVPALSAAPAVKVKALNWRRYGNQHGTGWQASGVLGYLQYIVDRGPDGETGWFWNGRQYDTLEAAKAAAEFDYALRIMAAVEMTVVAEPKFSHFQPVIVDSQFGQLRGVIVENVEGWWKVNFVDGSSSVVRPSSIKPASALATEGK